MKRVTLLVDGFNLYHSLDRNKEYHKYKWLDLKKMAEAFIVKGSEEVTEVYFFTALARWNLEKVKKHVTYMNALKSTGVKMILGDFKERTKKCYRCNSFFKTHEEKQTDVNIAISLLKLAVKDTYDKALILSGDNDLIPAIRAVKELYPKKGVGVVIPIKGATTKSIKKASDFYMQMKEHHLNPNRLPEEITLPGDKKIFCPEKWR